ncbi:MAG: site-specific DNA-methyltransferase, partial [Candidatus Omnitrophica bacterium]|nr:site-specific DNA-methyltransferase [Candidatus Omnitrophota bacterium]
MYKLVELMSRKQMRVKEDAVYTLEKKANFIKIASEDELYFHHGSLWIYNEDFLIADCVKDNSIDLIITSPPYNVDIHYNSYDDRIFYSEYLKFTEKWLVKCFRLSKDDGRFCLNIPLDKNRGGQQSVC